MFLLGTSPVYGGLVGWACVPPDGLVWLRKGRKCDWSILEFDGHGHNADNAAYRDSVLRLPLRPPQVARRFIALSYEKLGIPLRAQGRGPSGFVFGQHAQAARH